MNLNKLLLSAALLAALSYAQSPIGSTTLSGAVSASASTMCVASATGIVLPSLASAAAGSILLADGEASQVVGAGPTSTCFRVRRAVAASQFGGNQVAHASGAKVWILGATVSSGDTSRPVTSTTAFLSQRPYQPFEMVMTPPLHSVAAASVTGVAGKIWYSAVQVNVSMLATGACVLNGATVATDKSILALYDASGALLANSALAGTTTAGASVYQCIAFTAPVAVVGPAQYFLALQTNGTTDNFKAYAATAAPTSYPTGSQAGTFGTLPAIAVTTTFTASVGPYMTLY